MANSYKQNLSNKDVPEVFCDETVKRIKRIESIHSVIGTMFLRNGVVEMFTVPETVSQILYKKLPDLNSAVQRALTEIVRKLLDMGYKDVQNELVAYRILTKSVEIMVAAGKEYAAVVVHKVKRRKRSDRL